MPLSFTYKHHTSKYIFSNVYISSGNARKGGQLQASRAQIINVIMVFNTGYGATESRMVIMCGGMMLYSSAKAPYIDRCDHFSYKSDDCFSIIKI